MKAEQYILPLFVFISGRQVLGLTSRCTPLIVAARAWASVGFTSSARSVGTHRAVRVQSTTTTWEEVHTSIRKYSVTNSYTECYTFKEEARTERINEQLGSTNH
jgi:hypothetical protein